MSLSLKILIAGQGVTKTMRFLGEMAIHEVLTEIKDKTTTGGADHGLFDPPLTTKDGEIIQPGRWLKENKTLNFYNIQSGAELHYKKKHMPLKVKLIDGTTKVFLLDHTQPVSAMVQQIGEKINIKNHEEYSLATEKPLKGKNTEWLNTREALDEQGVPDSHVLIFKKRFYYSDGTIDKDDPISLHLLYVQSRDAIIGGDHPTTRNEARDLAALQLQVVLQNYDADKHKPGFFDKEMANDFLPLSYRKDKNIEKEIVSEWRKLVGMSEINAKFRYLQLCRSLKTYGISSFQVEFQSDSKYSALITKKDKKKQKLLLGVTRDAILFLDYETKELLKTWPLTQLKRWAANGSTTLTLDFGQYEDDYINLYTDRSEDISNLIAGYIDIILKSRKDPLQYIQEDDVNVGTEEDVGRVSGMATMGTTQMYISGSPSMSQMGVESPSSFKGSKGVRASKKQNITDLKSAIGAMGELLGQLTESHKTPSNMGKEQWNKQLNSELKGLTVAAEDLLNMAKSGTPLTRVQLDDYAKKLGFSVEAVAIAARSAAFLDDDPNLALLNATKAMTESLRDILSCVEEVSRNPSTANMAKLKQAQERFEASVKYMNAAREGGLVDASSTNLVLEANNAAQAAIGRLNEEVLNLANGVEDPQKKAILVEANNKLAKQAEVLGFYSNALSTGIVMPEIRAQFANIVKQTDDANKALLGAAQASLSDPNQLARVNQLHQDVDSGLKTMSIAAETAAETAEGSGDGSNADLNSASKDLANALSLMKNPIKDGQAPNRNELINQTREVAKATNKIIITAKNLAGLSDPATRASLLEAAKKTADAVSGLVASAKDLANNTSDLNLQQTLILNADNLDAVGASLAEEAERARALVGVRNQIKDSAAMLAGLIAAARAASSDLQDPASRSQLEAKARAANEAMNKMLRDLAALNKDPSNVELSNRLLASANDTTMPAMDLIAVSKRLLPKITDLEKKYELKTNSDKCAEALQKLMSLVKNLSQTGGDIDEALEQIDATHAELESAEVFASSGQLRGEPGQSREDTLALLNLAMKQLTNSNNQLSHAAQDNPRAVGKAAKDSGYALSQVGTAVKAVAAATADKPTQLKILSSAKGLSDQTRELIRIAKGLSANRNDPALNHSLLESAQKVAAAMAGLLATSRGLDSREVDEAVNTILAQESHVGPTPTHKDMQTLQEELLAAGKALQAAVSQAMQMAKNNPKSLGNAAKITATTILSLVDVSNALSSLRDPKTQEQMTSDVKDLLQKTSILLNYAKATAADSSNSSSLSKAAKEATDTLNRILGSVGVGSNPEVEAALESIINATQSLGSASLGSGNPLNVNLHNLSGKVKNLASQTSDLVMASRNLDQVGPKSKKAALAVEDIILTARETLASGKPVVPPQFNDPARHIEDGARDLINSSGDSEKVLQAARVIAASTAKLIQAAKTEASKETDPVKQQALLKGAQAIATSTSGIAKAAKAVQGKEPGAQEGLLKAGKDLSESTKEFLNLVAIPAKDDNVLSDEQSKKLGDAVRAMATATSQLISASNEMSVKPKDDGAQQQLSAAAKIANESILAVIKATNSMTPGAVDVEEAIEAIQAAVNELDATAISVTVGNFEKISTSKSHQECQEDLVDLAKEMAAALSEVINSSRIESGDALGKSAKKLASLVNPRLVDGIKSTISTTSDAEVQNKLLHLSKELTDSLLALTFASRTATLNPSPEAHKDVATKFKRSTESLGALVASLKSGVILLRDLDECLQSLAAVKSSVGVPPGSNKSYVEAKDQLSDNSKSLAASLKKLVSVNKKDLFQLSSSIKEITNITPSIIEDAKVAAHTSNNPALKEAILKSATEFGSSAEKIVQATKKVAEDPKNQENQKFLSENMQQMRQTLTGLLDQVKQGAVGEIMCEQATESIAKVISDFDTATLFAAAAQLEPQNLHATAAEGQKELINTAKQTASSAQQLLSSTKDTQEQFGNNAKNLASLISKLGQETTENAAHMANTRQQQALLSAGKAISLAAQQLIVSGKEAQRFKDDQQLHKNVSKGADIVASSIQELIKLTQEQESESAQGVEKLLSSRKTINDLLSGFNASNPPNATPDDLVKAARKIAGASAQLAQANGAQEQIIKGAQASVESSKELLEKTKGASRLSDNPAVQNEVNSAAQQIVSSMGALMDAIKDNTKTGIGAQEISKQSLAVADGISLLIESARKLPGAASLKLEEDFSEDLENVASDELKSAVKAIEDATAALLASRPPPKPKGSQIEFDTSDITAAIFDAAIAISKATAKLVASAAHAQQERLGQQKSNPNVYRKDPMWANGLISAAKSVAGATQQLVKSANGASTGQVQEEELVAVAKAVAAATAQLVTASKVKGDPNSPTQKALSEAAKTVVAATSSLVTAAKSVSEQLEEEESREMASSYTGNAVKHMEQQMKVLKLEKELEKARLAMLSSRQSEYAKPTQQTGPGQKKK